LSLTPLTGPTLKKADIILTGSKSTKNEILKYYNNINADKIHVTHLGVDKKFEDINGIKDNHYADNVKIKYDLKGKVVLFVGLVMNRRNVPVIMEAISNLKKRDGEDITFVILGHNHTYPYIDIFETAKNFDIEENVRWIKYTSDEEVFSLYKAADVFMCASLYEGFNITPLEALYLETPIICSNLSSLPEVVGEAAYMIEDPTDPVEMTSALDKVLSSSELRNDLRKKGLMQAQKFSWERCAKETMDIFHNMMNE
jgi:glycosyltransferase involved in cell wall biosynthesis